MRRAQAHLANDRGDYVRELAVSPTLFHDNLVERDALEDLELAGLRESDSEGVTARDDR